MATSVYFNNFTSSQEQGLLDDLIVESIRIYGHDVYYVPKTLKDKDKLTGDDDNSEYNKAIMVEMYIRSVDGFTGDGAFMSKFGLEIRDQVVFTIAKRTFDEEVGASEDFIRPREGDLVYFPLNKKLFAIRYVDNKPFFYQLGALQTYDLTCELFEYSSEQFNTGIPEIDDIQDKLSMNLFDYGILTEDDFVLATEEDDLLVLETYQVEEIDPFSDNDSIEEEALNFLDFTERDPFSEKGTY